jgi:hypothetical protein
VPSASDPQQLNRYAYALNSPLNYTDPSGHAADAGGALCGSACWRAAYNNYLNYERLYEGAGDAYHGHLKNYYNHVAQQYYNYATRVPAQSVAFQDSQVAAAYSQLLTNGLHGPEAAASAAWDGAAGFGFSTMFAGLGSLGAPAISAEKVPTGERLEYTAQSPADARFYSVAYETVLPGSSYPGRSRGYHNQQANRALLESMKADPEFAKSMENLIPNLSEQLTGPRGGVSRMPPSGWTWHHATETGAMQLVPSIQHTPGSIWWNTLHPSGLGGYALWGK